MTSFEDLGLPDELLRAIRALRYETPTPIQERAIPVVLDGADVFAEAQTGSGKTAAFALPILKQLCDTPPAWDSPPQVLVLVPTRELALQVARAFVDLGRFIAPCPRVLPVIGGEPIEEQIALLGEGVSIVVATPGRLLDLSGSGNIDLSSLRTLVLDEADRLLDAGFDEELSRLLEGLPVDRQTLLFSATLPTTMLDLAQRVLREPVSVRIDEITTPVADIQQRVYQVNADGRRMLLQHLLHTESWGQTLVFVSTKRATENLSAKLRRAGFSATALHGDLAQSDRIAALGRFRRGGVGVLVSTDLAARGIDVPRLGAVVNFDLPRSTQGYIHRIGRTGRAGLSGIAVSFVDHKSEAHFKLIEKRSNITLPREQVPGFELNGAPPKRKKGAGGVKGKRKSKKDRLREAAARDAPE
ncbi:MAG: ATP-dependent RNA helicase RhlE [Myxococcota bacterium]|jgi:ATP-dependent RNA helicase RhlE